MTEKEFELAADAEIIRLNAALVHAQTRMQELEQSAASHLAAFAEMHVRWAETDVELTEARAQIARLEAERDAVKSGNDQIPLQRPDPIIINKV